MGRRKKKRTHVPIDEDEIKKIPKALVFRRGDIGTSLSALITDMRDVMLPFTAPHLRERKNNTLKDFLNVSGGLSVSHFLMFSSTDIASYLRIARVPQGHTLTFRLLQYSLASEVRNLQVNPHSPSDEFKNPPVLVLNGFGQNPDQHIEVTRVTLRQMFPSIPVQNINLDHVQRVVLFNYDPKNDTIDFRHYFIATSFVGVNKSIKRVVQNKVKDLSQYNDISDYVLSGLGKTVSDNESEAPLITVEDSRRRRNNNPQTNKYLTKKITKRKSAKSESSVAQKSVKLVEIGPRLKLQLIKIEEGLCSGAVLHHKFVKKSATEIEELNNKKTEEKKRKEAMKKKLHFQKEAKKKKFNHASSKSEGDEENDAQEGDRRHSSSQSQKEQREPSTSTNIKKRKREARDKLQQPTKRQKISND